MLFVRVQDTLLDHRKLRRLERLTGLPRAHLRGHLVTLWLNVMRHRPDGRLDDWDGEDVDYFAEFPCVSQGQNGTDGTSGTLWDKLIEAGFIENEGGTLVIVDHAQHADLRQDIERRTKERERKRAYRQRKRDEAVEMSRDVPGTSQGQSRASRDVPHEKRREEKISWDKKRDTGSDSVPPSPAKTTTKKPRKARQPKPLKYPDETKRIVAAYQEQRGERAYFAASAHPRIEALLDEGVPEERITAVIRHSLTHKYSMGDGEECVALNVMLSAGMFPILDGRTPTAAAPPPMTREEALAAARRRRQSQESGASPPTLTSPDKPASSEPQVNHKQGDPECATPQNLSAVSLALC